MRIIAKSFVESSVGEALSSGLQASIRASAIRRQRRIVPEGMVTQISRQVRRQTVGLVAAIDLE